MRPAPRALATAAAGLALLGSAGCAGRASAGHDLSVGVQMRFSKFEPSQLSVPAGRPVRFVVHNADFIDHEFIVGDETVQRRHETGTETKHDAVPTEVDVPAGTTVETVITFPRATTLSYVCHAPGHREYGMVGTLTVG
ncbi:MAG: cupredoxin domain-containing protein [Mycobacteriales bacterium]